MNKEIDINKYITRYVIAKLDSNKTRKANSYVGKTCVTDRDENQHIPPPTGTAEAMKAMFEHELQKQQQTICTISGMNNVAIGHQELQNQQRNPYTCARISEESCVKISCPSCHWNQVEVGFERQIRGEVLRVARCRVCGHAWVIG
jgi:hypothetical protein